MGTTVSFVKYGEPAGTRTQGPRLKRAMLYLLSYRLTSRRRRDAEPHSNTLDKKRSRKSHAYATGRAPDRRRDLSSGLRSTIVCSRLDPVETRSMGHPASSSSRAM